RKMMMEALNAFSLTMDKRHEELMNREIALDKTLAEIGLTLQQIRTGLQTMTAAMTGFQTELETQRVRFVQQSATSDTGAPIVIDNAQLYPD
ncbi:TPA: hypothetical protein N0F65_002960, partial [Lagenidium giganteum]